MGQIFATGDQAGIGAVQIVMLAFAAVGLTVVMISTRRRIRDSRRAPRVPARERYKQLSEEADAARGVEQVMVELEQLSRQIHGRIDTKLARLETAIRDADRRIAELSKLVREPTPGSGIEITLEREDPHAAPANEPQADDTRYAAIYRLADSGMSPRMIAREVDKPAGEIELLLALRKTRDEASRALGSVR